MLAFRGSKLEGRRANHDVADAIDVSDVNAVSAEVKRIVKALYPSAPLHLLDRAFLDFERMYLGEDPAYCGCDTPYHDIQHSLDVALAAARLLDGYERTHRNGSTLGPGRIMVGILVALFHDCGYIRRAGLEEDVNGAVFTKVHVGRGGDHLLKYMPALGMGESAEIAAELIHYTGFERALEDLDLGDKLWEEVGHIIGTADLIAQMSDRCYLEKCRDFLYPEFVVGGEARTVKPDGSVEVLYTSAQELLGKTPLFYEFVVKPRIEDGFRASYRHAETHFGGVNLYMQELDKNFEHLKRVLDADDFSLLRRRPQAFLAEGVESTESAVADGGDRARAS